jgi:uncharacterized protein YodC (DUF2158 family)
MAISEDDPIYKAIDDGGGQCCDIPGILRVLEERGYSIINAVPAPVPTAAFKVGDVVALRSGGPAMTVYQVGDYKKTKLYDVCWFVGGDLHREAFSEPEIRSYVSHVEAVKIDSIAREIRLVCWCDGDGYEYRDWNDITDDAKLTWRLAAHAAVCSLPFARDAKITKG